jgi:hypothetical protein
VSRSDPQLGELTFDSDIGWWEGRVRLPSGTSFVLYVHTPSESDNSIADAARTTFEKMHSSEQAAFQFAAQELLAVHNREWNDGKKLAESEFIRRLVPGTMQLWPSGNAEISFGDGNLFGGHEVGVRYRGGKFTEAVVQG